MDWIKIEKGQTTSFNGVVASGCEFFYDITICGYNFRYITKSVKYELD